MNIKTILASSLLATAGALASPSHIEKTNRDNTSLLDEINVNGTNPCTWFKSDATDEEKQSGRLLAFIEQSFSYFNITNPVEGAPKNQAWYLLHAHLNFQLLQSSSDLGTWLKVEVSGSSALNTKTRRFRSLADTNGTISNIHTDAFDQGT